MKRFLSRLSVAATLAISTVAFAQEASAKSSGKVESIGPRQERRVVYRPVHTEAPYALTGQEQAVNQKLVRNDTLGGQRDRIASYRWVDVK